MTVGLGVDIVEIDRMRRVLDRTPAFARKVFTDAEQAYCNAKANPAAHYAARFAAKEAVCKALGTGILACGVRMTDVEVTRDGRGRPAVLLRGGAAEAARASGVIDVPLSLTYTHDVAVANAVAITKESQKEREKRRDVKAELAQQFKTMRSMLDDLGTQTGARVDAANEAVSARAKAPGDAASAEPAAAAANAHASADAPAAGVADAPAFAAPVASEPAVSPSHAASGRPARPDGADGAAS